MAPHTKTKTHPIAHTIHWQSVIICLALNELIHLSFFFFSLTAGFELCVRRSSWNSSVCVPFSCVYTARRDQTKNTDTVSAYSSHSVCFSLAINGICSLYIQQSIYIASYRVGSGETLQTHTHTVYTLSCIRYVWPPLCWRCILYNYTSSWLYQQQQQPNNCSLTFALVVVRDRDWKISLCANCSNKLHSITPNERPSMRRVQRPIGIQRP